LAEACERTSFWADVPDLDDLRLGLHRQNAQNGGRGDNAQACLFQRPARDFFSVAPLSPPLLRVPFFSRKSFQVSFVTLILPCSLHRHIECDRCRNPTPLKREITTGQPDPPVRPGGLWAPEREIPCGRFAPVRCLRTSTR